MTRADVHGVEWEWVRVSELVPGDVALHDSGGFFDRLTVKAPWDAQSGCWVSTGGIVTGYAGTDTVERMVCAR